MNDKLEVLNNILQARLRYVRSWGKAAARHENNLNGDNLVIVWSEYRGDSGNPAFFQATTYPIKMIDKIIKDQTAKLKRDLPEHERELLKSIL